MPIRAREDVVMRAQWPARVWRRDLHVITDAEIHGLIDTVIIEFPSVASGSGTIAQLQKLGDLKAQGILTEEEFAAQKAKILGA